MRHKQQVRRDCRLDLIGRERGKSRLCVLTVIGVRPTVEPALLHADQIIRWQVVTQTVALLHPRPKLSCLWMEGQRGRVASAADA